MIYVDKGTLGMILEIYLASYVTYYNYNNNIVFNSDSLLKLSLHYIIQVTLLLFPISRDMGYAIPSEKGMLTRTFYRKGEGGDGTRESLR